MGCKCKFYCLVASGDEPTEGVNPICRMVANDEDSYRYLVESIRRFPKQQALAKMVKDAQFSSVGYENLSGGIVAVHSGFKHL